MIHALLSFRYKTLSKEHEGFYIYRDSKMNKKKAILAARLSDDDTQPPQLMKFGITRPNTGLSRDNESLSEMRVTYYKTTPEKAEKYWIYQYNSSSDECKYVTSILIRQFNKFLTFFLFADMLSLAEYVEHPGLPTVM